MKALQLFTKKAKGKKGFTLVELVIVIAVLAIIAAIAIPSVTGVIKNANKATDDSNCQALSATIKTFAAEYEADSTHNMEGAKGTLTTSSKVSELFSAYGVVVPTPKQTSGQHFFWQSKTKTVVALVSTTAEVVTDKGENLVDLNKGTVEISHLELNS